VDEGIDYKKWWLGRYTRLNYEIDRLLRSLAMMRGLATHTTQTLDAPVVQSGQSDKTADIVSRIVDTERKVDAMVDEREGIRKETCLAIKAMSSTKESGLLYDHYIRGITLVDIAKRAGKCRDWAMTTYRTALENVYIDNTGGSG
jgi:hypothetical protein